LHPITVQYSGDATYQASSAALAVTVTPATATVTLSASVVHNGQAVSFMAIITPPALPFSLPLTGFVTFYDGTHVLGTVPVSTATLLSSPTSPGFANLITANLGPGSHSITARYTSDPDFVAAPSAAVTVVKKGTQFSIPAAPAASVSA
jgi:hypothetical protein